MDNYIKSRDTFIKEEYSKISQEELNEGIFDFFKTLAKNEWKSIKSKNTEILKELEKNDRELTGFTLIKLKKAGKCTQIRQALCDFANTLWEAKEKELEDGDKLQRMLMGLKDKGEISDKEEEQIKKAGTVSKYLKQFDIKDKALADNLKNYEKKINDLCDGDPDLTRWSNLLKNDIRNIVNNLIIKEYDKVAKDEDKKKEEIKKAEEKIKKQQEEQKKKGEKVNQEEDKETKKQIEEIEKERKTSISNLGVSPVDSNKSGDKIFQEINTEFKNILDELEINVDNLLLKESEGSNEYSFDNIINEGKLVDVVSKDTLLGIKNIPELKKNAKVKATVLGKKILKELGIVFNVVDQISKNGEMFKELPGDSVQAMYVGLTSIVTHAMTDGKLDDNAKNLLSRCAISDKTIGYGLPKLEPDKEDSPNVFVAITDTLRKPKNENAFKEGKKKEVNKDLFDLFKKNINTMFDEVSKFAEELKEKKEKENEQEAKKAEQEENKE